MHPKPNTVSTTIAFLIAVISLCLLPFVVDPTPLLVEPQPDLDIPLGFLGVCVGFWSAHQITRLSFAAHKRWGRWAFKIMLPLWLGFGLPALSERLQERHSFRSGGVLEEMSARVSEKSKHNGRRKDVYKVRVIGTENKLAFDVRVDAAAFHQVQPNLCATLLIERAPDGAARLVKPLRWNVRCR